jgi:hypothetical protein
VPRVRLNPSVRFEASVVDGRVRLQVNAPVRGQGLRRSELTDTDPGLLGLLAGLPEARDGDLADMASADRERLTRMGVLLAEHETPGRVLLDLRPAADDTPLSLAAIELEAGTRRLPEVAFETPAGGTIAWVRDAVQGHWYPHVLEHAQLAAIARLADGASPRALEPAIVDGLLDAGILVHAADAALRASLWRRGLTLAGLELQDKGYSTVPGLLPRGLVRATAAYYAALAREGFLALDSAYSLRYVAHRDPFAEWLHEQVAQTLAPALGTCRRPSYSFVSAYQGAAKLPLHTDRPPCEVTVSVCIDATPGALGWPLLLQSVREDALVDLRLGVGHAVIFKGREIAHSRPPLPAGERFVSLLFHFVDAGYAGSLD